MSFPGNVAVNSGRAEISSRISGPQQKRSMEFRTDVRDGKRKKQTAKRNVAGDASGQDGQGMPFNPGTGQIDRYGRPVTDRDQTNAVPANFSVKNFGLVVDKLVLDLLKRDMTVEKIVSANTDIKFVHGKLDIADKDAKKTAKKTMDDAAAQAGFNYSIARFELDDWSLYFENRVAGKPGRDPCHETGRVRRPYFKQIE